MSTGEELIHRINDTLAFITKRLNELAQPIRCDRDDLQWVEHDRLAFDDEVGLNRGNGTLSR